MDIEEEEERFIYFMFDFYLEEIEFILNSFLFSFFFEEINR